MVDNYMIVGNNSSKINIVPLKQAEESLFIAKISQFSIEAIKNKSVSESY